MVVDDSPGIVRSLVRLIGKLGCEVVGFVCPLKAWEDFKENPDSYDVVFTDQIMPGMSGQELLDKMTKLRPGLRTILGSGSPITSSPPDSLLLRKPYMISDLTPLVEDVQRASSRAESYR